MIDVLEAGEEQKNELLLDNTTTRNRIIDELYELSAFLSSRREELTKHSETILSEIPECTNFNLRYKKQCLLVACDYN